MVKKDSKRKMINPAKRNTSIVSKGSTFARVPKGSTNYKVYGSQTKVGGKTVPSSAASQAAANRMTAAGRRAAVKKAGGSPMLKKGAEGPKRSTPVKKTVAKRTTIENRGAMLGSGSKTTKINTPKAGVRFVERFPSGKSNIRPARPSGRKAKGK